MEKSTYTMGKVWVLISQVLQDISGNQFSKLSPIDGFGCLFPGYGKSMGKHMHFPCDEVYHKMEI